MSEFLDRINYFYKQTDGTYLYPNRIEGYLLKLAHQEIQDMHVLYRMQNRSKGCGCCCDYETQEELYSIAEAIKLTHDVFRDNTIDQQLYDNLTTEYEALRKRMGVKSYDEKHYGEAYADDE